MEEYLVTLSPQINNNPAFPLMLTEEYYERNRENEAAHTHVASLCLVKLGNRIPELKLILNCLRICCHLKTSENCTSYQERLILWQYRTD